LVKLPFSKAYFICKEAGLKSSNETSTSTVVLLVAKENSSLVSLNKSNYSSIFSNSEFQVNSS
jgi:hypothetical protein